MRVCNITQLKSIAYKAGYLLKFTGHVTSTGAKHYALYKGQCQCTAGATIEEINNKRAELSAIRNK